MTLQTTTTPGATISLTPYMVRERSQNNSPNTDGAQRTNEHLDHATCDEDIKQNWSKAVATLRCEKAMIVVMDVLLGSILTLEKITTFAVLKRPKNPKLMIRASLTRLIQHVLREPIISF